MAASVWLTSGVVQLLIARGEHRHTGGFAKRGFPKIDRKRSGGDQTVDLIAASDALRQTE